MKRRNFLKTTLTATMPMLWCQPASIWGGPVLDTHLHLRKDPDACFTHIQGCGVTNAVLLTGASSEEIAQAEMEKRPKTFVRSVTADPSEPGALEVFERRSEAEP